MRAIVGFAPAFLLLAWAGTYLRECFMTIAAPGKPVEFRYKAPAGFVTVRAESYNVNLRLGFINIFRPVVVDPDGTQVASASAVQLRDLDWRKGSDQTIELRILRLKGHLVRLASGSFQFMGLIPERNRQAGDTSFHVIVDGGSLVLEDQDGGTWRQVATTDMVEVSGLGRNWVAHGAVSLPGMGSAAGGVQNVPGRGVRIVGSTPRLNAGLLVSHVLGTREATRNPNLRYLHVGNVTVSGPFDLFVPSTGQTVLQASAQLEATEFAFRDYRLERLDFGGVLTSRGVRGRASAKAAGLEATLNGAGTWSPSTSVAGLLEAKASSSSALPSWVRRWLPPNTEFGGAKYSGWVSLGEKRRPEVAGRLFAASAAYDSHEGSDLDAAVRGSPNGFQVDLVHGVVDKVDATGSAEVDLTHKAIAGWVQADAPDLAPIASRLKVASLEGQAHVEAIVEGPIRDPQIEFVAGGEVDPGKVRGVALGAQSVDLFGTYAAGTVLIQRGSLDGRFGTLTITGQGAPGNSHISMHVEGRGLQPEGLVRGVSGSFDIAADVSGTAKSPVYSGRLEGVDLAYRGHEIAAAEVEFSGDRRRVSLQRIVAVSGTIDLSGSARCEFPSNAISGELAVHGISAAEYLGDDFAGTVDLPEVHLLGTLEKPIAVARLKAAEIVAREIVIRSTEALVRADREGVVVDRATASVAGGSISANGSYSFRQSSGEVAGTVKNLDLGRLAPALGETVAIAGVTSVSNLRASIKDNKVSGSAAGTLDRILVNGVPVGEGNWSVSSNGDRVSGSLSIGQVQPDLRVIDAEGTLDLKDKTLVGTLDASNARIRDLVLAANRYLPSGSSGLQSVTGDLTVLAKLSGEWSSPDASITTLELKNLTYQGSPYGSVAASGLTRIRKKWTVPDLALNGPEGRASVKGSIEEDGKIALNASLEQFRLSWLSPWVGGLAGNEGIADARASATGATKSPVIAGSASIAHLFKAPPEPNEPGPSPADAQLDLRLDVPRFSLDDHRVDLSGSYSFEGFGGSFSGGAPFSYSEGLGKGPVQASVRLDERALKDIPIVSEYLDPARTSGTVAGEITVSGPLDALAYRGGVDLKASSLGIRFPGSSGFVQKVDDTIEGLSAFLHLMPDHTLALSVSGRSQRGGSFSMEASTPIVDVMQARSKSFDETTRRLLDGPLDGHVTADRLSIRQTATGGYVAGQISGSSRIGGTVGKPAIGTEASHASFHVSNLDTAVPALPAASSEGTVPIIDPSFYVDATLESPARVRSATADLTLLGSGDLRGVLSDPRASANLSVQSGNIRLPGGTIRLDRGGTVAFRFRHPFAESPSASLEVDLQGHSSLTAIRYGGNTQRYDVLLEIRGDLLKDQGLQMQAFSNPPDLSSEEALAQLGALGYVEGLGSAEGGQTEAQRRITQALAGFALPAVTDPFSSSLARSLGLSYISVEYNPFELTTLSTARSLGTDFSLQYRGQVGQPAPGFKAIQDIRLVFTPARVKGGLRNFSLSLGSDQIVPWKVGLEYGMRFGGPKGPASKTKTRLFP